MSESHLSESKRNFPPSYASQPASQSKRTSMLVVLLAALIALPWLSPFSSGPSAAVWPQWFGMVCLGLILWQFLKASDTWFTGLGAALLLSVGLGVGVWIEALTATSLVCLVLLVGAARLGYGLGAEPPGRDRWLRAVAWGWVVAALLSCVLGLLQYFKLEGPLAPFVASSWKGESFANLRQKNQFASLVNMTWFACAWLAVGAHSRSSPMKAWVLAFMATVLGVGNAMAASRTGLVQMGLMLGLALWWGWTSRAAQSAQMRDRIAVSADGAALAFEAVRTRGLRVWALAAANLGGFIFGTFVLPLLGAGGSGASIVQREAPGAEGCHSRLLVWRNVWQLATERPLAGWGWGHLDEAHYFGKFNARFCEILDNAHNLPLHLAVELGLPVAMLVCSGVLWFMLKTWPRRGGFEAQHMAWGVLAAVLLHSLLEYPLWYAPFQTAAALAVGMLCAGSLALSVSPDSQAGQSAQIAKKPSNWHFVQHPRHLFAIILGVILTGVAWDYGRVSQMYLQPEQRAEAYRADTLEKIKNSWLFEGQVGFAELSVTTLTPANAAAVLALAQRQLVYSPEPRVIEKLLESAAVLGRTDLVALHRARYAAAFPAEFKQWSTAVDAAANMPAPRP